MEISMQENLLTADQVARYLKVDRFTIYRLVSKKKIPAFKVGSQWRFKRKLIETWLQKNSNLQDSGTK
jgi:excisionase family DNA binding protein